MHEYSLIENLLETVTSQLEAQGVNSPDAVKEVCIRVGALAIHSEESFAQAFQMRAHGTVLSKAKLCLELVPGRIKCENCGNEATVGLGDADCHDALPVVPCPKCAMICKVEGGRAIEPIEVVLEDLPA
jgi:hydrogenase nickel incorporation protein HypA/HybF